MTDYNKVFTVKIYLFYYWIQRIMVWTLYRAIFRCRIEGQENLDLSKTFLILSNHCSYLDPPLIGLAVPKPIAYMTKSKLFKIPVLNKIMYWSGAYSITRGIGDNSFIDNTIYALKNGWLVTIFPEGGRTINGRLMPVKPGAAKILLSYNVPFLPVVITNIHKLWGKGSKKFDLSAKPVVKIGKMVYPHEYIPEETLSESEKIEHIRKIYASKLNELLPDEQKSLTETINQ